METLGQKAASMVDPGVMGSVLGGTTGALISKALSEKYPKMHFAVPIIASAIPALVGGSIGRSFGAQQNQQMQQQRQQPMGAPYAIDPTNDDIPDWAVAGARMLQPRMKQSNSNTLDWLLGEVPGGNSVQYGVKGYNQGGVGQGLRDAGKSFGAMSLGGLGASAAGLGAGKLIEHLAGRPIQVPLINESLPNTLAGLFGTIGATKALGHVMGPS